MRFRVYGVLWGGGAPDPLDVLKRFVVEITPEELMAMAASKDFDILISGNDYIAFDGNGRGFRQR